MNGQHRIEDLLRELAPQVLGALVRRCSQFDACEDAVQEAMLAAAVQWPVEGIPDRPRSWLLTVAARALVDAWRADSARRRREPVAAHDPTDYANEGYTTSSGPALQRTDLIAEAIRLTRLLHRLLPGEAEAAGLLALMLFTDARRAARTGTDGRIVPLAGQQRDLWDTAVIAEGQAILTRTLGTGPVGPYQLQAAIAALHDEAPTAGATDWPQILALYDVLTTVAPGPVVTLSRAVALAHVHGPTAGLALLGTLDTDERMAHTHRLEAVRAHLLEQAGETAAARHSYLRAAKITASLPEQRYLELRAARLHQPAPPANPGD